MNSQTKAKFFSRPHEFLMTPLRIKSRKTATHHCHVGVAGKQFQVDLLVDHSFGVGVEIQPDLGRHLAFFLLRFFGL